MSSAKKSAQNKTTLVMSGNLSISRVLATRDELTEALKITQNLEIDIGSAKEIDLSFLQLLCSAHRTSIYLKKNMTFKGTIPEEIKKSIGDNGFTRPRGCEADSTNTCLWLMK